TEPFPHDSIKERPLISFSTDDSMHELVDKWIYAHQDKMKPVKTITVDQIETCKQFMKQGLGMAVLPESVSDTMREEYPNLPLTLNNQAVSCPTLVGLQEG
ncbi:LysR substrate-binding domain-containing protein, partial [Virgibacillus salexigens]|uniref:LysR substrate-binding domain-containing protein n=1 Tax=Virgibacillus salexigens TaxID=61016 RepID=UPI003082012F